MDRFEGAGAKSILSNILNLHSSMDRFEATSPSKIFVPFLYLHSSMDRFEANFFADFLIIISIYIPVWIDLKPQLKALKEFLNKFTFQYG